MVDRLRGLTPPARRILSVALRRSVVGGEHRPQELRRQVGSAVRPRDSAAVARGDRAGRLRLSRFARKSSSTDSNNRNRDNAQHSTGPKTAAGKAAVSQNARTHGLTSKSFIIFPGQESEFAEFSENLRAEFQPEGTYQDFLFRQVLLNAWNMERCTQAEGFRSMPRRAWRGRAAR